LFLTLAEKIAQSLNISSCFVCVGTNMGDQWSWEAKELDSRKLPNGMGCSHFKAGIWLLKTSILGKNCLAQWGGKFNTSIGNLTCLGQRFYNATAQETHGGGSSSHSKPNPHPLSSFHLLQQR
jgi:hypothetical protein